jgi:hypothetical protein
MESYVVDVTGIQETWNVFEKLRQEVGNKETNSKILIPAAKAAMLPVLTMAQSLVPRGETGMLAASLDIVARKPTNKDMRSNYVSRGDSAIAIVTTKPIPKKLKKEMFATVGHLWNAGDKKNAEFNKARKAFYESKNVFYDARAVAMEFGTKNVAARPYMRVSLESQSQMVSQLLGMFLKQKIEQYRSKNI